MPQQAQQIVADACQICKAPGFTAQAGRQLNLVLYDLCSSYSLGITRKTSSIVVGTSVGPYNLESDYIRTQWHGLFYYIDGQTYFLEQENLDQYDQEFQGLGINNYPQRYATDISTSPKQLYVYPPSSGQITLTHRYIAAQPDIVTPETSATVPWFPDQNYLLHATATFLMRITDDERWAMWESKRLELIERYLKLNQDDNKNAVQEVKRDPRRFRNKLALPATKVQG